MRRLGTVDFDFPPYHQGKFLFFSTPSWRALTVTERVARRCGPTRCGILHRRRAAAARGTGAPDSTQPRLRLHDVVAGDRDGIMAPSHLNLEHHQVQVAQGGFRAREMEFLHPHEACVTDAFDVVAMGNEAVVPGGERLRMMQAQDLDVGAVRPARWRGAQSATMGPLDKGRVPGQVEARAQRGHDLCTRDVRIS
jgi:hypothetical protein